MALTDAEISRLVDKLKARYGEYSRTNPTWFNLKAFEGRLAMARENRMNMEGFVLAEIANFEKTREKYEKKKGARSFSDKVDQIIEEQLARIKKYPAIPFHPKAGVEITHFYGALSDFTSNAFAVMFVIASGKAVKDAVIALEQTLKELSVPRGSQPPRRIEDHALLLERAGVTELDIDRDRSDYLKESAFVLHDIIDLCDGLIEARDPDWENPLRFDKLFVDDGRKKKIAAAFSGLTGYGAILAVREKAAGIIEDFRLGAFRRRG